MEAIEHPKALKTIFVYLINAILFLAYYMVTAFLVGFIVGMGITLFGNDVDTVFQQYAGLEKILSFVALLILILLTIFLKKNIYFSVKRTLVNTV